MDVCVFGQSFVRKLEPKLGNSVKTENGEGKIHFVFRSGGTATNLMSMVDQIPADVRVVFMQIGDNDIHPHQQAFQTATIIMNLVRRVSLQCPGALIFVGSIFPRFKPQGMSREVYNRKRVIINTIIADQVRQLAQVRCWDNCRKVRCNLRNYAEDRVHLNEAGNSLFAKTVMMALKIGLRRLQ
ncbi:hypothetical protein SNE40_009448 [Patella caerulea]|uniref:SGNH hydrolase-type esterase domain-containing protein n=1 Tax=Patella caerulea TaxID=87958 RepID=A0AAN8JS75_PATCE